MGRILVVEDEPLISMMVLDWLDELGHEAVGPASTIEQALSLIEGQEVDAAIVDVNLHGQESDCVAAALKGRNIRFAVATGLNPEMVSGAFGHRAVLTKPYDFGAFRDTLVSILEHTGAGVQSG